MKTVKQGISVLLAVLLLCAALPTTGVFAASSDFEFSHSVDQAVLVRYTGDGGDVVIPSTWNNLPVTTIGEQAFADCHTLTSVTVPNGVTSIEQHAFLYSTIERISLPDSITSIGPSAFAHCGALESIVLPDSITDVGAHAFLECTSLSSVKLPNNLTAIANELFYDCPALKSITIPEGVTTIGNCAFRECTSLTSVTIPKNVTTIQNDAFSGCTSLADVSLQGSVTIMGTGVFTDTAYYNTAENWEDGSLYIGSCLIRAPMDITSYTFKEGITAIAGTAFAACDRLTSITIPEGITNIGLSTFSFCFSLTDITLPESVTTIGMEAFSNCSSLQSITLPKNITTIARNTFSMCSALKTITIPENVTSIEASAFSDCSALESVTIPESVTVISDYAFHNCTVTIHGAGDSYAHYYAMVQNIPFQDMSAALVDADSGARVKYADGAAFGEGTVLSVQAVTDEGALAPVQNYDKAAMVDVALLINHEPLQPDAEMRVYLPLSADVDPSTVRVFRVESDGALTDMQAAWTGLKLTFTTTQFGRYAVVGDGFANGDVNHDGVVNTTDARLVLQYAVEKITANDLDLTVADVNKSGKVDTTDARLILQKAVDKIEDFG